MEFYNHQCFIFVTLFLNFYFISCRTTVEQVVKPEDEKVAKEHIRLHVITKREAMNDLEQVYPRVDGRTFRASDPLDPNSPASEQNVPQSLLDSFDTVNEIFQPQVNDEHSESGNNFNGSDNEHQGEERTTETAAVSETETGTMPEAEDSEADDTSEQDLNVQNDVSNERQPSRSEYTERSRVSSDIGSNSRAQYETPGTGYSTNNLGTQQRMTSQRVVLAGRGPNTHSSQTRSNSYQSTGATGPYYGGTRYVDNNGHYVDARGRHLDSTGRYYDVSGRYPDATMTRTVTYRGSGGNANNMYNTNTRTGYDSGTGSGYYDSSRGYGSQGGSRGGRLDSAGRYVESGSSQIDQSRSRPVNSYGGTQFYSSGNTYQTTYNPGTSQMSSDTTCANSNDRITVYINDLECQQAISQIGRFVCYNYERVSTECCQTCLQVKQPENEGCEYGDRSAQCETIRPSDCYGERNRQVCCNRCRTYRDQMQSLNLPATCSYGDLTPRCQTVAQRNHLCYLPENQRVCCATCPRYANQNERDCQWGDQSPEFCEPFDEQGRTRINCYRHETRDICCSTCRSLRDRLRETIPGCEYGDYPIMFYVGRSQMTCTEYIRQSGVESCDDPNLARQCCYTCYRYRQVRG